MFFTQSRRENILTVDGNIDESQLTDPTVYKSGIHFQFKYHLYHIGLLTGGGTDSKADVLDAPWQLNGRSQRDPLTRQHSVSSATAASESSPVRKRRSNIPTLVSGTAT